MQLVSCFYLCTCTCNIRNFTSDSRRITNHFQSRSSRRRARCRRTSSNRCCSHSSRTEKCENNGSTLHSFRQASSLRTLIELQGWYRWCGCAKLSTFVRRSIPRVASFEVRRWRSVRSAGSSRSVEACDSVPNPLASTSWRHWWYNYPLGSRDGAARSDRPCHFQCLTNSQQHHPTCVDFDSHAFLLEYRCDTAHRSHQS